MEFQGYESVKELHRVGPRVVWLARRKGQGGRPRFVIKHLVADPDLTPWSEEEAERQVQLFLARAAVQGQGAEAGGWAAVHRCGRLGPGPGALPDAPAGAAPVPPPVRRA